MTLGVLDLNGRRIEIAWHRRRVSDVTLVFLHEGLGCTGMWRDFPEELSARTGLGAFVYSRFGYGGSDPAPLPRPLSYMHDEAKLLPQLLDAAGIKKAVLVGHSDGASIALLHAGSPDAGDRIRGLLLEAPHVFCEELSVRSIARAKAAYELGDLRKRLERWHGANVDVAFWGWNGAWLDPDFMKWNIEFCLPTIRAPVLLIQGKNDEYGTTAQLDAIESQVPAKVERAMLEDCGHSPHRDQRQATVERMVAFLKANPPHAEL